MLLYPYGALFHLNQGDVIMAAKIAALIAALVIVGLLVAVTIETKKPPVQTTS